MSKVPPQHGLTPPSRVSVRLLVTLAGLAASCAVAHAEGLAPTSVKVNQTPSSACQSEALHVSFDVDSHAQVTAAIVTGITPPCFDKTYRLTVLDASGGAILTTSGGTGSGASTTVPLSAVAVADVDGITLSVSG